MQTSVKTLAVPTPTQNIVVDIAISRKGKLRRTTVTTSGDRASSPAQSKPYESLIAFGPAVSDQQMKDMELSAHNIGVNRRIMMAVLRRSGAELRAWALDPSGEDSFVAALNYISDLEKHLQGLLSITHAAEARLMLAGGGPELAEAC